jgi:hypothetical protein
MLNRRALTSVRSAWKPLIQMLTCLLTSPDYSPQGDFSGLIGRGTRIPSGFVLADHPFRIAESAAHR